MITLSTTLALIITAVTYFAIPTILVLCIHNDRKLLVTTCVFTVSFFLLLFICTLSTVSINNDFVTIEFVTNGKWCAKPINFGMSPTKTDLLINIFMLFPIGAFVVMVNHHKQKKFAVLKAILVGLLVGFCIELLQFVLPVNRSVQLSDMLLNSVSVFIGACYFRFLWWLRDKIYVNKK